jgi:voltage-gated potassium channel Kch
MVSRLLRACGERATILDHDVDQVEVLKRFGMRSYYGDAARMELLHAAGAAQAKLLLICIDDSAKATQIAEAAHKEFPNLKILVRAFDRVHAYELMHKGFHHVFIETSGSALNLGVAALRELGCRANIAEMLGKKFQRFNDRSIRELAKVYHESDDETFISHSKEWVQALEKMLQADVTDVPRAVDRAWESPPRMHDPRPGTAG